MAVSAITTSMMAGVNYTSTTDNSADWSAVTNNTYFYDKTNKIVYYKNNSGLVISAYDTFTGGTVNGLTATTISATTYQNLPDSVTGNYLPLSGGTVTGQTFFTSGVSISGSVETSGSQVYHKTDLFVVENQTINGSLIEATNSGVNIWSSNTNISIDAENRILYDSVASISSIDWENRQLIKSDGTTVSFDWENGVLTGQTNIESSTISATTYQNLPNSLTGLYLPTSGGTVSGNTVFNSGLTANTISANTLTITNNIDSSNRLLIDSASNNSLSWDSRTLTDNTGTSSVEWQTRGLYDSNGGSLSVDWENRSLSDNTAVESLSWQGRDLIDSSNNQSINWENRVIYNSSGVPVIDWESLNLNDASGVTILDWNNKILTGMTNIRSSTISATTYQNLPNSLTGLYLPTSGGTVSGSTIFTQNITVTGGTGINRFSGNTSSDLVRITQTGTGNAFVVEDDTTTDTSPFVINSSGNVGIGTTSPDTLLEILSNNGSTVNGILRFRDTDTVVTSLTEQFIGKIEFFSQETSGGNTGVKSYIAGIQDASANSSIVFATTGGTGTLTGSATTIIGERMRINSTGNVGIGTTSPSEKLQVSGNVLISSTLSANTISATTYQNLPNSLTGLYLPTSGGTVSGNTIFTQNISVTGGTGINWFSGDTSTDLLRVTQTGTGNAFVVEDSTNPDSTPFVITSGGSTFIGALTGNTSAGGVFAKLQVSDGNSGVSFSGLPNVTTAVFQSDQGSNIGLLSTDATNSQIYFGTPTDAFGSYLRWDYTNRNLSLSTANSTGKLIFNTANSVEAARIDQNGNFGINTNTPTTKLHVKSTGEILRLETTASTGNNYLTFYDSTNFKGYVGYGSLLNNGLNIVNRTANEFISFWTSGSPAISEKMRITADGNVGIGTETPTEKLQLNDGNIFIYGISNTNSGIRLQYGASSSFWVNTPPTGVMSIGGVGSTAPSSGAININSSGNVGIGTSSPTARLTISGGSGVARYGEVFAGYNGITLNGSVTDAEYNFLSSNGDTNLYINRPSARNISFRENNTEQMVIQASTGNLGIGTISPTEKLQVSGNTLVNGTLSAQTITITNTPTSGYTTTQILMRNSSTGNVEITDSTSPSIYNYGMSYAMTTFNYLT